MNYILALALGYVACRQFKEPIESTAVSLFSSGKQALVNFYNNLAND